MAAGGNKYRSQETVGGAGTRVTTTGRQHQQVRSQMHSGSYNHKAGHCRGPRVSPGLT